METIAIPLWMFITLIFLSTPAIFFILIMACIGITIGSMKIIDSIIKKRSERENKDE